MKDDPTKIDVSGLISIGTYDQIQYWCTRLGCTDIELAEAIATTGYSPELVQVVLANKALDRTPGAN
jgi:hypothetical protein